MAFTSRGRDTDNSCAPVSVAYNAHSRVHAVALLIDRDWHDQICEQASAAVLWFEFIGRACDHWHAVLRADVTEAVVLQAREAMRAMEDSWQNLDNMEGGRRNPSEQAFGSYSPGVYRHHPEGWRRRVRSSVGTARLHVADRLVRARHLLRSGP